MCYNQTGRTVRMTGFTTTAAWRRTVTDFRPERGSYEPLPAQNAEQFAANEYPGETKYIPVGEYPQQGEAYPQQGEAYPRQGGQPSFEAGSYEPLWA